MIIDNFIDHWNLKQQNAYKTQATSYSRSSVQLRAVSQIDYRYGVKKVCKEWADYQLCPSINQLFDLILSDRRAKQSSSVLLVFSWCKYTSSAHRHKYDEFCKSKDMVQVKKINNNSYIMFVIVFVSRVIDIYLMSCRLVHETEGRVD